MSSDPLSQFRKEPVTKTTSLTTGNSTGKRPYAAYDTSGKLCPYMEFRCVTQSSQSRFFMASVFSTDFDDGFTLLYSFIVVEVRGKNLKDVRRAIQQGRCEFIQEYHENEFLPPRKGEPVIESVKFITGDKLDDILATHKVG